MISYESYLGARNLKLTEKYKLKPKLQQLGEKKNVCGYFTFYITVVGMISSFLFDKTGGGSFF